MGSAVLFVFAQEPDELFETVAQCLLSGVDRDALSGWGGIVYVMYAPKYSALVVSVVASLSTFV